MPCKFAKPALPSRPCNPFHKPRELPRQPGTVSPALFCYIFFGFSSTTHVINRASFYKKWGCPSSSWKHPWLTALLTGKPCAALQHIEIFFSPATFSLLLALQTLFRMLPVCCIQIKDQTTRILHQADILQILLWAERGTQTLCVKPITDQSWAVHSPGTSDTLCQSFEFSTLIPCPWSFMLHFIWGPQIIHSIHNIYLLLLCVNYR